MIFFNIYIYIDYIINLVLYILVFREKSNFEKINREIMELNRTKINNASQSMSKLNVNICRFLFKNFQNFFMSYSTLKLDTM